MCRRRHHCHLEVVRFQAYNGLCHAMCALQMASLGRHRRKHTRARISMAQAEGSGEDAASGGPARQAQVPHCGG
jgi:hypothetical protein